MKKYGLLLGILIVSVNLLAQSKFIEINICDELKYKNGDLVKISYIYQKDTIQFPQVELNLFINPVLFYGINLDSGIYKFLIENNKYIYTFMADIRCFQVKSLDICGWRQEKGYYTFRYKVNGITVHDLRGTRVKK